MFNMVIVIRADVKVIFVEKGGAYPIFDNARVRYYYACHWGSRLVSKVCFTSILECL